MSEFSKWLDTEIKDLTRDKGDNIMLGGKHAEAVRIREMYRQCNEVQSTLDKQKITAVADRICLHYCVFPQAYDDKERMAKEHCLFEQSGTFKNEFKKLGIEAYDYDILNDYGETDYQIDLFAEIEGGYKGEPSIFDKITKDDLILAFFPCTRFSSKIPPWLRGESYSQRGWNDKKKLKYSIDLHNDLHTNYVLISKMAYIAIDKGLKMVIENPYNHASYLTMNWCIKPAIIDKDRRINGDKFKKPTQYFFLNCEPKNNIVFEPLDYVETQWIKWIHTDGEKTRQELRSEIHPQYASRFIRQYLIDT